MERERDAEVEAKREGDVESQAEREWDSETEGEEGEKIEGYLCRLSSNSLGHACSR